MDFSNSISNRVDIQSPITEADSNFGFGSWLPINGTTKFIEAGLNKFRVHGDPNSAGILPYLRISNDSPLSNTNYTGIIMQSMWLDDDHFALCYGNGTWYFRAPAGAPGAPE
jgi:hypothetical protein